VVREGVRDDPHGDAEKHRGGQVQPGGYKDGEILLCARGIDRADREDYSEDERNKDEGPMAVTIV
jgi:hypothetical protein